MGGITWDPSRGDREIFPSDQVGYDFRNSSAGSPPQGGPVLPQGGGGDFQMPEWVGDAYNKAKEILDPEVLDFIFSGLKGTAQVLGPSLLDHYMGQEGRENSKAMYDAQASLLNQQTKMLTDRHTNEEKPRANLLEAIASRMKQQAPSFLPDRPPPRRPYANVRRYDPRLTHQGRGDGYATRLSDALAYKWNPMGGR